MWCGLISLRVTSNVQGRHMIHQSMERLVEEEGLRQTDKDAC